MFDRKPLRSRGGGRVMARKGTFFEALKQNPPKMWPLSSREGGGKALVAGPQRN